MCGPARASPVTVRQGLNHSRPAVSVPYSGLVPVGDHERLVHGEEGRQLGPVGLELLPGGPDRGVLVRRVLQLDDSQRQAVDEQYHVGPPGVPVLCDGELVDGQEVVGVRLVEVDGLGLRAANVPFTGPVLHRHALDQHPVEGVVAGLQGRTLRAGQPAECVV